MWSSLDGSDVRQATTYTLSKSTKNQTPLNSSWHDSYIYRQNETK